MAITKTWLNNSVLDRPPPPPPPLIQLHGFQPLFRRGRSTNQQLQGGGKCLFVGDDVPAKRREDLEQPEMELLWRSNLVRYARENHNARFYLVVAFSHLIWRSLFTKIWKLCLIKWQTCILIYWEISMQRLVNGSLETQLIITVLKNGQFWFGPTMLPTNTSGQEW